MKHLEKTGKREMVYCFPLFYLITYTCLNHLYARTWQMCSGQSGGITIPSSVCCVPQIEADTEDFVSEMLFSNQHL